MHVHFIIPAYNEVERLPRYLNKLLPVIAQSNLRITLQIVDDGSDKRQLESLKTLLAPLHQDYSFFVPSLLLDKNLGKGGAVYTGWNQAPQCDILGFVDADGSIPPHELIRLSKIAISKPKMAIFGSRVLMLGRQVDRSLFRHYVGRGFATLVGTILNIPIYDSQCGIKLIPSPAFRSFAADCEEYGFAFDMELLLHLYQQDCHVAEEAIDWHDTPGSKVNVLYDGIKMAVTLLRLRKRFLSVK